jgi:tetratricopeptide (TPR) repeat protein
MKKLSPHFFLGSLSLALVLLACPVAASQQDRDDRQQAVTNPDKARANCAAVLQDPHGNIKHHVWAYNNRAIAYSRKLAASYINRGNAYNTKGDYDRAIKDYNDALQLDPNFVDAYIDLADVYTKKGDYDRAIEVCNKAIQLDLSRMSSDLSITSAAAYNNRGDAYAGKGDKEKAIADYRKALSINPSYQDAKDGLKKFGVSVP